MNGALDQTGTLFSRAEMMELSALEKQSKTSQLERQRHGRADMYRYSNS